MVYYSKFTMVYYSKTQCFCGIFTTLYHSKYYGLPLYILWFTTVNTTFYYGLLQ